MTPNTTAIIAPEPFTPRVERIAVQEGQTIAGILLDAVRAEKLAFDDLDRVAVYINGESLEEAFGEDPEPRAAMLDYVPAAGALINLAVEPLGGGGGGGNKVLQTVLTIAVIAVSMWIGGPSGPLAAKNLFLRTAAAATVAVAGQMAVAAIFSPETEGGGPASDSRALQGASNEFRPRQPFPLQLGRQRAAADLAAAPYTQNIGGDVWLHVPLAWHYGPCTLDAIRIGETLLADYPAADVQVEHFLAPGPRNSALYPGRVAQENFTDELDFTGGGVWEVHTAAPNAEILEVDVTLPNGLLYNADSGKKRNEEVAGQIQFAEEGSENWTAATFPGYATTRDKNNQLLPPGSFYFNQKTTQAIRRTFRWETPDKAKRYKVRVKAYDRDGDFPDDGARTWSTYWTAIRAIENVRPILDEIVSVTFLRIRSTDDLNGNLPTVTAEVTPIVPVWNGADWSTQAPTSNEAAIARWLVTGPAAAKPLRADQVDGSCVDAFNLIEANQWGAAVQVKDEASQKDVLIRLGRAGRFGVYWNGRKLCFVPDWEKLAPRQIFSGRNAAGYRYRRSFPDPVHAIIVEYQQRDDVSIMDELIVYADGFDATNAYLFETVRLDFATDVTRAFKEGRAYLAKRALQVETHEWTAGADSLATTWGDRVLVRHLSTLYGEGEGRVNYRHLQGALVAGVRIDQAVTMVDGVSYSIDVRRADGVIRSIPVQTVPGTTRSIMFAAPRAQDAAPEKGDLVIFGRTDLVTEDVEIVDIERNDSFTANIRAVRYIGEELVQAETGPIPPLQSGLTPRATAPTPRVIGTSGDPSGVVVVFDVDPVRGSFVGGFAARWRRTAEAGEPQNPWNTLDRLAATAREVRTPAIADANSSPGDVQAEYRVDVEIRSILTSGRVSPPAYANGILVTRAVLPPALGSIDFAGVTRAGLDGSTYPALYVAATPKEAGDVQDLVIEVRDVTGPADGWASAGQPLPARNPVGDMLNVQGGRTYDCRARWRTADNWASDWLIEAGVYVPPGQTSTDTIFVGGIPATDLTDRLLTVEGIAALNAAAVADLEDIYGDTASAAASAVAAAASASTAAQAKADAIIAQGNAQTAASTATTKAGEAVVSASQSATSASNAAGSATTASDKATVATNAATAAGGSASAAATSATNAASSATSAGTSATAATTASVTASTAASGAKGTASLLFPDRFNAAGDFFYRGANAAHYSGAPETNGNPAVNGGLNLVLDATYGWVSRFDIQKNVLTQGVLPATPGKIYEFVATWNVSTAPTSAALVRISLIGLDSSYAYTAGPNTSLSVAVGTTGLITHTRRWAATSAGGNAPWPAGAIWLRPLLQAVPGGGVFDLVSFAVRDVTALAGAEGSAIAAATSASNASASETASGQSASAAQTAATTATTKAGEASTSASSASTSATNAAGSASTAATQAGLAANSRDAASGSASAAAGSASTASTKAGEAGTSAAAASASQVAASTSATAAQLAAIATFPTVIVADLFSPTTTGAAPEVKPSTPASWVIAGVFTPPTGQAGTLGFKQYLPWTPGAIFDITAIYDAPAGGDPTGYGRLFALRAGADYGALGSYFRPGVAVAPGTEVTQTARYGMGVTPAGGVQIAPAAGLTWVSIGAQINLNAAVTGSQAGAKGRIKSLIVRDVTALAGAEGSASAAATSASNASASETAAGQSATAASGSATTASTQAGNASTFASQASTSASNAAGSATTASNASGVAVTARDQANSARDAAQGSAATALTQAANASASASSASISANLAAQVGLMGGLHVYPTWGDWSSGTLPPNSILWQTATSGRNTASARYGVCLEVVTTSSANGGVQILNPRFLSPGPMTHVVVDYEVTLASGNFGRSGGQINITEGASDRVAYLNLFAAHGAGVVGQTYTGSAVIPLDVAAANPSVIRAYLQNNNSALSGGTAGAKVLRWHRFNARAATQGEIASGKVDALEAQLSVTSSTVADIATRMATAKFEVIAAAGSDPAQLLIRADSSGSLAAIVAGSIRMSNVVGGVITEVMRLEGGRALFAAPISIIQGGRRTTLGPGFGVGAALHLWSGPSTVAFGSETIDNGILGVSTTDGWFGGRTYSGPFDSGAASATAIDLSLGTVFATVNSKPMLAQGFLSASVTYDIFISGSGAGDDPPNFNVTIELAITNQDGSGSVVVFSQFGEYPRNVWTPISFTVPMATINTTKGDKKIVLRAAGFGVSVRTPRARNGRIRGLYGA